jgi:hypothetical protein
MPRHSPLSVTALCAATLVLASCSDSAAPLTPSAPAETPSFAADFRDVFVGELVFDFFNDCTGELVPLRGTVRVQEMELGTPAPHDVGSFVRTFQIIQNGSGLGEISGRRYKFNDSHIFEIRLGVTGGEVTEVTNAHVVSQGSIAFIHLLTHVTRNATGEITVSIIEQGTVTCR